MFGLISTSPCYGCEDRDIGCHAKCIKYISWAEERKDNGYKAYQNYATEKAFDEYVLHAKVRNKGNKGVLKKLDRFRKREASR